MLLLLQLMKFSQFLATLTAINGIWSVTHFSYSNKWNLVSSLLLLQQLMEFGQFLATLKQLMEFGQLLTSLTAINGIWSVPCYSYSN